MADLTYFAVGVSEYQDRDNLRWAAADVRAIQQILGTAPEMVAQDLKKKAFDKHIRRLQSVNAGSALIFHWAGHAEAPTELVLFTSDDRKSPTGLGAQEAVRQALDGGAKNASQLLFVFDVCHAGAALELARRVDAAIESVTQASQVWVGILVSCLAYESAQDGAFGKLLQRLLEDGPTDEDLRTYEWSFHKRLIDGEALGNAVLKEWPPTIPQRPDFQRRGYRQPMIPNPLYRPDAPPVVVEHLLRAARGGADKDASAFTGRVPEVNTVVAWVTSGTPGLHILTGPPGTGKSAILGRVVSLSNPTERRRLIAAGNLHHDDPGEGSIAAHAHVRGMNPDQVAAAIDEQLEAGDILPKREGKPRNTHQLIGDLRQRHETTGKVPCLAIDGLDEAGAHAEAIARELLLELQVWATVIVSTRDIPAKEGSLLDVLDPARNRLDLASGFASERTRSDVYDYLVHRLTDTSPIMDAEAVANVIDSRIADDLLGEPFLFARLLADVLVKRPIDTRRGGWEVHISTSFDQVFRSAIDAATPPPHRPHANAPALARAMLTALTWSFGAGFPVPEWCAVAEASLPADLRPLDMEDIRWLLNRYGQFVIQDGEGGEAVYRLAHASLAESLRSEGSATDKAPSDASATPITNTLLHRYQVLLDLGAPTSSYLWRYIAAHATAGGTEGINYLRRLVESDFRLTPDLAAAMLAVAGAPGSANPEADAPPPEEATTVYRDLDTTNPDFPPEPAGVLSNLGFQYSEV
jgi:hypothetical protein